MKTPKKYSDLVNQNKITEEILGEVIYSINKRAKNWRNQKRKYKNYLLDQYDSYDNAVDNEKKYYKMKSDMLEKFMYKLVRYKLDDSLYYLYYKIGGYTFHQPIEKSELENFKDLDVDVLEDFETF